MLADREFTDSERREVMAHLEQCGECAKLAGQWQAVQGALLRTPQPEPSEAFVGAVMDRLSRPAVSRAPSRTWLFSLQLIPRLGIGVAGLLLTLLLIQQEPLVATELLLLSRSPLGAEWEFSPHIPDAGLLLGVTEESP